MNQAKKNEHVSKLKIASILLYVAVFVSHIYILFVQLKVTQAPYFYNSLVWTSFITTTVLFYVQYVFREYFDDKALKSAEERVKYAHESQLADLKYEIEVLNNNKQFEIEEAVRTAQSQTLASMSEHPELHPIFNERDNYAHHYKNIKSKCDQLVQKTNELEQAQTQLKQLVQKYRREIDNKNQAINRLSNIKRKLRSQLDLH